MSSQVAEGVVVGAIGGLVAAAVWAVVVWLYSFGKEYYLTQALTKGIVFDGYGGIHRSPYLLINNINAFPISVCGVRLEFSDWNEKYFIQRIERKVGEEEEVGGATVDLLPGQWSKWVFTPGVDIPDTVNNLTSCTVIIKYPSKVSADNYLEYSVHGETFITLQDQVRSNKRNIE